MLLPALSIIISILFSCITIDGFQFSAVPVMMVRAFLRTIHINQFRSAQSLSCVQCFEIPWRAGLQASLSTEFSRQEYWSGLSFSSLFLCIVYRCYPFPLGPVQVLVFWESPSQ